MQNHPLEILSDRCATLAARVREGQVSFIDAIDMAYSAADFAGLIESYGDDRIQGILASAFMGAQQCGAPWRMRSLTQSL